MTPYQRKPCPPNCDPAEWERHEHDNEIEHYVREHDAQYQAALVAGAPGFSWVRQDCPEGVDAFEWERAQQENEHFAYEEHKHKTVRTYLEENDPSRTKAEETWPLDMREAEAIEGKAAVRAKARRR